MPTKLFDGLKPAGKYVPTTVWKEVHYTLLQCLGVGVPSIAVIIGLLNPAPECGELDGHGYGGGFCFINESAYLIGTFYVPAIFTGVFALYSLLYWSTKVSGWYLFYFPFLRIAILYSAFRHKSQN